MNNQPTVPDRVGVSARWRDRRRLVVEWAKGTGLALMLVSVVYMVSQGLGDALLVSGPNGSSTEVTLGNIFGMTLLGGSIGAAMAFALDRWARRPRATFVAVGVLAIGGYAVAPFVAAETLSTAIWLNVFHVTVAIPVVGFLARGLPRTRSFRTT